MPKVIQVQDGQNIGDVARVLVVLAQDAGLPQPETTSHGPRIGFIVSDDLYDLYDDKPAPEPVKSPVQETKPDVVEPKTSGVDEGKKTRKKKGN